MCDDADRCGKILELVGYMTITVIGSLQKNNLFAKDSQIPNIGIMLALVLSYAHSMGTDYGWEDQVGWTPYVVKQATIAQITLAGPKRFDETLEGINELGAGKTAASQAKWSKGTFPSKVCLRAHFSPFLVTKLTVISHSLRLMAREEGTSLTLPRSLLPRGRSTPMLDRVVSHHI